MIAYDYYDFASVFWKFQRKIALWECCLNALLTCINYVVIKPELQSKLIERCFVLVEIASQMNESSLPSFHNNS